MQRESLLRWRAIWGDFRRWARTGTPARDAWKVPFLHNPLQAGTPRHFLWRYYIHMSWHRHRLVTIGAFSSIHAPSTRKQSLSSRKRCVSVGPSCACKGFGHRETCMRLC